ncbi:uncharacterized protein N7459_002748 [Penicillium hispanicum]|uniref:uncharacterized protein n=1 Tax=Penicillium hispanicum TaxID=1080232 RepID=UPI002541DAF6|nr:uncharacterized protein N7459_002748 [Penicillium hispanicum]KAJ5586983.1 hypothetical protein N7459_002748 [Penicillium hispanicum]
MEDHPTPDTPIKTIGLREVCEVNGRHFSRRKGAQRWDLLEPDTGAPASTAISPLYLSLVLEAQGPGEPFHWSLFVARENQSGLLYQVKGDAEYMVYEPSSGPIDIAGSEDFYAMYQLGTVSEEQALVVKEVAENEMPPRAPDRRSVRENCQGWAVRVIGKLVDRGIVSGRKLEMARSMLQSV